MGDAYRDRDRDTDTVMDMDIDINCIASGFTDLHVKGDPRDPNQPRSRSSTQQSSWQPSLPSFSLSSPATPTTIDLTRKYSYPSRPTSLHTSITASPVSAHTPVLENSFPGAWNGWRDSSVKLETKRISASMRRGGVLVSQEPGMMEGDQEAVALILNIQRAQQSNPYNSICKSL